MDVLVCNFDPITNVNSRNSLVGFDGYSFKVIKLMVRFEAVNEEGFRNGRTRGKRIHKKNGEKVLT